MIQYQYEFISKRILIQIGNILFQYIFLLIEGKLGCQQVTQVLTKILKQAKLFGLRFQAVSSLLCFRSMVASTSNYRIIIIQIASIMQMNGKNGQYCIMRVNFIGDTSHADLRLDKVKKWDQKPQQLESKKLKEAVELASSILTGTAKATTISLENLNDHALKNLIMKLDCLLLSLCSIDNISDALNKMSNNELLGIIKLNLGQQLFSLHQVLKNGRQNEIFKQTQQLVDKLTAIVGFKQQNEILSIEKKIEKPTPNSEDTNQITDTPIKKKKIEDISKDTLFNQN